MEKLLRLEQELIKAKEYLAKQMDSMAGSQMNPADAGVNTAMKSEDKKPLKGRQSELDQDKDGDIEADDLAALREKKKKMHKAEHPDEKEDKKLIAEALDRHNEKKHGEAKDKDSAKKDMGLKKSEEELVSLPNGQWVLTKSRKAPSQEDRMDGSIRGGGIEGKRYRKGRVRMDSFHAKTGNPEEMMIQAEEEAEKAKKTKGLKKTEETLTSHSDDQRSLEKAATKPANPEEGKKQQFIDSVINQTRKPATVTDASGKTSVVSPEKQVQAQKDSAADKKAKFEAEAAARRSKYREEGSLK